MFKRNLALAFRHLWKQKWITLLHLGGLSVGMASTLLLFLFVRFEYTYDQSLSDSDQLYKLIEEPKLFGAKLPVGNVRARKTPFSVP